MGQSGREGCNILILNSKNINKNYMVQKKKITSIPMFATYFPHQDYEFSIFSSAGFVVF